QRRQMWARYFPEEPHRQPRPRKWVFHQYFCRQAQILANPANLVLKEIPEWLDQGEGHLLRQSADVMVRLDGRRGTFYRNRFDDVRIQGPLHQESNLSVGFSCLELLRFLRKDGDEFPADALAFLLGIREAFQLRK